MLKPLHIPARLHRDWPRIKRRTDPSRCDEGRRQKHLQQEHDRLHNDTRGPKKRVRAPARGAVRLSAPGAKAVYSCPLTTASGVRSKPPIIRLPYNLWARFSTAGRVFRVRVWLRLTFVWRILRALRPTRVLLSSALSLVARRWAHVFIHRRRGRRRHNGQWRR